MRRHALHIAVALLTFAAAFLLAESPGGLPLALPLAALVFLAAKILPALDLDTHGALVILGTLLFWSACASLLLTLFAGPGCVALP